jgi:phosphohistidine swiveling domain-containing protein
VFEAAVLGSQAGADRVPVPGSRGLRGRLWGSHPYVSSAVVASADDRERRAARAAARVPDLLAGFPDAWRAAADELDLRYERLAAAGRRAASQAASRALLADAVAFMRHAWLIHFELMYPLLEGYGELQGLARRLGIDERLVPALLQGYPTRVTETDAALWRIARAVIDAGLASELAAVAASDLPAWLAQAPVVRSEVEAAVARFGGRTDSVYEVSRPPWSEDVTPLLRRVRGLLDEAGERSFDDVQRASADRRRAAEAEVLGALRGRDRGTFAVALERARAANFAWWNEEHNPAIDLRAHIPLRRAAQLVAGHAGFDAELVFYLFLGELEKLAAGQGDRHAFHDAAAERSGLHRQWAALRPQLPAIAGTAPSGGLDPVLREIFGVSGAALSGSESGAVLQGLAAAPGHARGRARVVRGPDELDDLRQGDVLVCEATTPAWTPAFATIAACVCNAGGSLTHAAIVGREFGIPCVTAVPQATERIATGTLVEVDGDAGRVRIV